MGIFARLGFLCAGLTFVVAVSNPSVTEGYPREVLEEGLTKISEEILSNPVITKLRIADSSLECIPPRLWELGTLEYLIIVDTTGIKTLPPGISKLKNLQGLTLQRTDVKEVPREIGDMEKLSHICLEGNNLKSIPSEITALPNLTTLFLGRNLFTEFPFCDELNGTAPGHDGTGRLDRLSFRVARWLSWGKDSNPKLSNLGKMVVLDLSHNKLTLLPASVLFFSRSGFKMRLEGNPLLENADRPSMVGWREIAAVYGNRVELDRYLEDELRSSFCSIA